jgi:4a-hydroxytetrahydrobiopterin dehydratase
MDDLSLIPIIKKIEPEGVLNRLKHFFTAWHNKKPDETNLVVLEQRILNYDYTRKLNGRELIMRLRQFPYWSGILLKRPHLRREFAFSDHRKAIIFINLVSEEALLASHYPKIINSHLRVSITLRTVEVDGISNKDFALARAIDLVADKVGYLAN